MSDGLLAHLHCSWPTTAVAPACAQGTRRLTFCTAGGAHAAPCHTSPRNRDTLAELRYVARSSLPARRASMSTMPSEATGGSGGSDHAPPGSGHAPPPRPPPPGSTPPCVACATTDTVPGTVLHGVLNGQHVAVRRFGAHEWAEMEQEAVALARISNHPNVAGLLGCCLDPGARATVRDQGRVALWCGCGCAGATYRLPARTRAWPPPPPLLLLLLPPPPPSAACHLSPPRLWPGFVAWRGHRAHARPHAPSLGRHRHHNHHPAWLRGAF